MQIIGRKQLGYSDLHLDATYQGGRNGNAGDDPLPSLLSVSNQGGFRYLGKKEEPRLIVLTTSLTDPNWPDEVDLENGVFTYYGDNKTPGRELHDTPRFGNKLLAMVFDAFHSERRERVPPFLIFSGAGVYRDMAFRGLAVPGVAGLSQYEDLIAVWKVSDGHRFQNYRAKFSILDVACVSRQWLKDIQNNLDILRNAPREWIEWVLTSKANILRATRTIEIRSREEQMPSNHVEVSMLSTLRKRFFDEPHKFEACAAEIVRWALGNVVSIDITRPSRDGGKDAVGKFQIGSGASSILVGFAVEAKCYSESHSVGVKETSRLISRLRHRQFGILVTTSWVSGQAYKEIKEDGHPIMIMSGLDIIRTLKANGLGDIVVLSGWLNQHWPKR